MGGSLTDFRGRISGPLPICLCVCFRYRSGLVAQKHSRGLKAVLPPEARRSTVTQLMGMPTVSATPLGGCTVPLQPLLGGFTLGSLPEFPRHTKSTLTRCADCPTVALRRVKLARCLLGLALTVCALPISTTQGRRAGGSPTFTTLRFGFSWLEYAFYLNPDCDWAFFDYEGVGQFHGATNGRKPGSKKSS